MPTFIEMMAAAAVASNCSYKPYNQMAPIEAAGLAADDGGGGICYGLAVVWLEEKFKTIMSYNSPIGKKTSAAFLANASIPDSHVFARSHLFFTEQLSTDWQRQTGLTPSKHGGRPQQRFFNGPDDLDDFCTWLCAAAGERFFLVHVPGHTMAAIGSSLGRLQFFDPNAGIVSTRFKSRMVACLKTYFGNERVKDNYKSSPTNLVKLKVDKFH